MHRYPPEFVENHYILMDKAIKAVQPRPSFGISLPQTALVQGSVSEHFMTEPFDFFFQTRLAAPEFDEHLAVFIRAMEQCLIDLIFEPFKISNERSVRHVIPHYPRIDSFD